jgi:hypothetical protein
MVLQARALRSPSQGCGVFAGGVTVTYLSCGNLAGKGHGRTRREGKFTMSSQDKGAGTGDAFARIPTFADLFAYQVDALQRGVLFLDVMSRREEQSREHTAQVAPNALEYRAELVCDGRTLPRPVNYLLARIVPPGGVRTSDGTSIDLRNIRAPIVLFCSKGDNITPPQQALYWILDLYDSVDEIRAHGPTIVYAIHDKIGHLGIFVSAGVAKKEHDEFTSNSDFIDVLPPGLYEAILEPRGEAVDHPELVTGNWVMRCEERTLDDIRALGGNDIEDERRFAAAVRLSEINLALYRAFAQPMVRAMVTPPVAEALKRMHPLRLRTELFGPRNPFARAVQPLAEQVRAQRKPAAPDNPFLALQERMSEQIVEGLETFRKTAEKSSEEAFLALYGTPGLQAALGVDTRSDRRPRKAAKNLQHRALVERRIAELKAAMPSGALREALLRALVYVGTACGGNRRTWVRGGSPVSPAVRGSRPAVAAGVQGTGPRTVLHAPARRGRRAPRAAAEGAGGTPERAGHARAGAHGPRVSGGGGRPAPCAHHGALRARRPRARCGRDRRAGAVGSARDPQSRQIRRRRVRGEAHVAPAGRPAGPALARLRSAADGAAESCGHRQGEIA